ncbi:hypothetical protein [Paraburkholderia sp. UYCP14C]|uniref:hypothetical protein n=1 Tax=Paraburkholderia sp. UYCP14C TaxID=2511130 RepID=UPI0020070EFE|nr:hypothetical protein [Paraburkholderia sp. UYCP14C]
MQSDDRAFWIEHWRRTALDALDATALDGHPERAAFRRLVETWGGHADVTAVSYRLVRAFYYSLYDAWFGAPFPRWTRGERTFESAEGMAGTLAEPAGGEPLESGLSNVVV